MPTRYRQAVGLKYKARVKHGQVETYIGTYDTYAEALAAENRFKTRRNIPLTYTEAQRKSQYAAYIRKGCHDG